MKHVFGHSYWDLLSMIKTLAARLLDGYDRSIETQEPESLNKILSRYHNGSYERWELNCGRDSIRVLVNANSN